MVKYQDYLYVLYNFINGTTNIPCYVDRQQPSKPTFPYITYEIPFGSYSEQAVALKLRTNDGKLTTCVKIVDNLKEAIEQGVKLSTSTGGYMVVRQGDPFAQLIDEDIGDNIKTFYINLEIQIF